MYKVWLESLLMITLIKIFCIIINFVNDKLDFKLPCLHNVTSVIESRNYYNSPQYSLNSSGSRAGQIIPGLDMQVLHVHFVGQMAAYSKGCFNHENITITIRIFKLVNIYRHTSVFVFMEFLSLIHFILS